MEDTVAFAQKNGYVQTLMAEKDGCGTSTPQLYRPRFCRKDASLTHPGTAADMIKMAMIRVQVALKKSNFKGRMIMQVHDELVFGRHCGKKRKI